MFILSPAAAASERCGWEVEYAGVLAKHVLTGSEDKSARLWDASTGAEAMAFKGHAAPVTAVAFSPDGRHVLTGAEDNTARSWEIFTEVQVLIDRVRSSVPRCLTPLQRANFHLSPIAPRWCRDRGLWPYGPGGDTASAPEPETWEERVTRWFDRVAGTVRGLTP